jgi:hypothetical protein
LSMIDPNVLLSDEFVEFAQKIAEIQIEKKAKEREFKKVYDAFLVEMKDLEDKAVALQASLEGKYIGGPVGFPAAVL